MSFVTTQHKVHEIRQGDERFLIKDGFVTYPRAMLHVLPGCPENIRLQLNWAMAEGYIKCVANVTEREMLFIGLTDASETK